MFTKFAFFKFNVTHKKAKLLGIDCVRERDRVAVGQDANVRGAVIGLVRVVGIVGGLEGALVRDARAYVVNIGRICNVGEDSRNVGIVRLVADERAVRKRVLERLDETMMEERRVVLVAAAERAVVRSEAPHESQNEGDQSAARRHRRGNQAQLVVDRLVDSLAHHRPIGGKVAARHIAAVLVDLLDHELAELRVVEGVDGVRALGEELERARQQRHLDRLALRVQLILAVRLVDEYGGERAVGAHLALAGAEHARENARHLEAASAHVDGRLEEVAPRQPAGELVGAPEAVDLARYGRRQAAALRRTVGVHRLVGVHGRRLARINHIRLVLLPFTITRFTLY